MPFRFVFRPSDFKIDSVYDLIPIAICFAVSLIVYIMFRGDRK